MQRTHPRFLPGDQVGSGGLLSQLSLCRLEQGRLCPWCGRGKLGVFRQGSRRRCHPGRCLWCLVLMTNHDGLNFADGRPRQTEEASRWALLDPEAVTCDVPGLRLHRPAWASVGSTGLVLLPAGASGVSGTWCGREGAGQTSPGPTPLAHRGRLLPIWGSVLSPAPSLPSRRSEVFSCPPTIHLCPPQTFPLQAHVVTCT